MRKTKIVATIGPATNTPEASPRCSRAGMNVARLNFSHGTHEDHRRTHRHGARRSRRNGPPLAILQDLQGPKIRTGALVNGARSC